jgi:hypothetical protein
MPLLERSWASGSGDERLTYVYDSSRMRLERESNKKHVHEILRPRFIVIPPKRLSKSVAKAILEGVTIRMLVPRVAANLKVLRLSRSR